MRVAAYYNEIDEKCCAWLRELIKKGLIADGDIDNRSIADVRPEDFRGYTQCHFFAGIGVWSYALRLAGWDDARPVWTGSCPCQPFSVAGARKGTADRRHLWPNFLYLIDLCGPAVVFGEQVASKDGRNWLSTVRSDLETLGYAVGAADMCAAGVGAPHIRQRLYWGARRLEIAGCKRWDGMWTGQESNGSWRPLGQADGSGHAIGMANADFQGLEVGGQQSPRQERASSERGGKAGGLADHYRPGRSIIQECDSIEIAGREGGQPGPDVDGRSHDGWSICDWVPCSDGVSRPVEPGSFPLAHGAPARVGRLRGYGNGLVAQAAQAFIEAFDEACYPG